MAEPQSPQGLFLETARKVAAKTWSRLSGKWKKALERARLLGGAPAQGLLIPLVETCLRDLQEIVGSNGVPPPPHLADKCRKGLAYIEAIDASLTRLVQESELLAATDRKDALNVLIDECQRKLDDIHAQVHTFNLKAAQQGLLDKSPVSNQKEHRRSEIRETARKVAAKPRSLLVDQWTRALARAERPGRSPAQGLLIPLVHTCLEDLKKIAGSNGAPHLADKYRKGLAYIEAIDASLTRLVQDSLDFLAATEREDALNGLIDERQRELGSIRAQVDTSNLEAAQQGLLDKSPVSNQEEHRRSEIRKLTGVAKDFQDATYYYEKVHGHRAAQDEDHQMHMLRMALDAYNRDWQEYAERSVGAAVSSEAQHNERKKRHERLLDGRHIFLDVQRASRVVSFTVLPQVADPFQHLRFDVGAPAHALRLTYSAAYFLIAYYASLIERLRKKPRDDLSSPARLLKSEIVLLLFLPNRGLRPELFLLGVVSEDLLPAPSAELRSQIRGFDGSEALRGVRPDWAYVASSYYVGLRAPAQQRIDACQRRVQLLVWLFFTEEKRFLEDAWKRAPTQPQIEEACSNDGPFCRVLAAACLARPAAPQQPGDHRAAAVGQARERAAPPQTAASALETAHDACSLLAPANEGLFKPRPVPREGDVLFVPVRVDAPRPGCAGLAQLTYYSGDHGAPQGWSWPTLWCTAPALARQSRALVEQRTLQAIGAVVKQTLPGPVFFVSRRSFDADDALALLAPHADLRDVVEPRRAACLVQGSGDLRGEDVELLCAASKRALLTATTSGKVWSVESSRERSITTTSGHAATSQQCSLLLYVQDRLLRAASVLHAARRGWLVSESCWHHDAPHAWLAKVHGTTHAGAFHDEALALCERSNASTGGRAALLFALSEGAATGCAAPTVREQLRHVLSLAPARTP